MSPQEMQEKSISERLDSVLAQLSTDQMRWVIARDECATDGEAAKAIGIKPDTVYHWPPVVREAVRLIAAEGVAVARHLRKRALAKAMWIKTRGLDSRDERIRQNVATEIIEWEMGRAELPVSMKRADELTDDELAAIAAGSGAGIATPEDDPA